MIKEALQYLADLGTRAAGPHFFKPPAEPEHVYLIDGDVRESLPAPREHRPSDLTAIINFASTNLEASVWYSRCGVTLFVDDDTRRVKLEMPLTFSRQLSLIQSWGDCSKPYSQREFILMFRTCFKRCMGQCSGLIDIIKSLKFESGKVAASVIGSSKASVSRSIESKVSGAADVPEEIYLNVPVFADPFGKAEAIIDVALEVDGGTEKFTLHPVPGTIERQICLAEQSIGKELIDAIGQDRVFYGVP